MGFVTYSTRGALTYGNMELDGQSPQDVAQAHDDRVYAILHCQHRYFRFTRLQKQFLRKFVMSGSNDMYILPVTCLVKPLLVIPDIKDHNNLHHQQDTLSVCLDMRLGCTSSIMCTRTIMMMRMLKV